MWTMPLHLNQKSDYDMMIMMKGQVHVFAGRVKLVNHLSCGTSAILKYFCPLTVHSGLAAQGLMT